MKKDFEKWEPNIRVSVWGKAKATLQPKSGCPLNENPQEIGAKYPGDCDNCEAFMGAKIGPKAEWGSIHPACCWLKVGKST